jgi:23S rRNA (uridine2552-2'-O)-methyltransferase
MRAKAEGYRARSVYKLMELDRRFHLITPGMYVLDVGAAPGSWLQYAGRALQGYGLVVGIDREPIAPLGTSNVITFQRDIWDSQGLQEDLKSVQAEAFDLLLSDLAPNTSGVAEIDQFRSIELNRLVLTLARRFLRTEGTCVLKVFRGEDFDAFLSEVSQEFARVRVSSPRASRDRSREVYLVCQGWKARSR